MTVFTVVFIFVPLNLSFCNGHWILSSVPKQQSFNLILIFRKWARLRGCQIWWVVQVLRKDCVCLSKKIQAKKTAFSVHSELAWDGTHCCSDRFLWMFSLRLHSMLLYKSALPVLPSGTNSQCTTRWIFKKNKINWACFWSCSSPDVLPLG